MPSRSTTIPSGQRGGAETAPYKTKIGDMLMEIDRKELKRQARERMALTDPKFWVVALAYIVMTTGVSWLFSFIPIPHTQTSLIFFNLLLTLYTTVIQFGLCLWALWTYRQLDPGVGSLMQGFSVAGRVLLMELGIFVRIMGWYFLAALGLSVPFFFLIFTVYNESALLVGWLLFLFALLAALAVISLRYALAPYLLADRPDDGPSLPIYRSVSLMRGWKWELFKLEFSFIGWEILNFILSTAVVLFFLGQAGLLPAAPFLSDIRTGQLPDMLSSAIWLEGTLEVIYSTPVVILSTLVTIPLSLWLIPYKATARAGFYDARLTVSQGTLPEMPPL